MPDNRAPRSVEPAVAAAVDYAFAVAEADSQPLQRMDDDRMPLVASSAVVRSGLPLDTRRQIRAAERAAGIAIGNRLMGNRLVRGEYDAEQAP